MKVTSLFCALENHIYDQCKGNVKKIFTPSVFMQQRFLGHRELQQLVNELLPGCLLNGFLSCFDIRQINPINNAYLVYQ